MTLDLLGRHFLKLADFTPAQLTYLLELAATLKANKRAGLFAHTLAGKNIALIFEKPSTRTRCAFTVACVDEGAHPEYLGKGDIQLGKKESVKDTARVLGRMFDGIEFRGFSHQTAETLAEYAGVPVWNGLTDEWHPTQVLADLQTLIEEFGSLQGLALAYLGDGRNNMASSLLIGCAKMGMEVRVVAPEELQPGRELLQLAEETAAASGGKAIVTTDPELGVEGAHALYTDVWASMGEEDQIQQRISLLKPYKVTSQLMAATGRSNTVFLHCLPAFHDLETGLAQTYPDICEVEDAVFEGAASRVFPQAENRIHTIKAVMVATLGR